jgi:hypothetical protein
MAVSRAFKDERIGFHANFERSTSRMAKMIRVQIVKPGLISSMA